MKVYFLQPRQSLAKFLAQNLPNYCKEHHVQVVQAQGPRYITFRGNKTNMPKDEFCRTRVPNNPKQVELCGCTKVCSNHNMYIGSGECGLGRILFVERFLSS